MDKKDLVLINYEGTEMYVSKEIAVYLVEYKREIKRLEVESLRHEDFEPHIEELYGNNGFENDFIQEVDYSMLHKAMEDLSELHKRRIKLFFYHGLTYEKIALQEGVSPTAIYLSIEVAKRKIKKSLSKLKFNRKKF